MDGFAHGCADLALSIYEQALSSQWFGDCRAELGWSGGGGLFSPALTIWLGIRGRMGGVSSVEHTWLSCSVEEACRLSPKSSRAKGGSLSAHASGYDYARRNLPLAVAIAASDHLFQELRTSLNSPKQGWFLLDGSTLSLKHSPELAKAYPPAENQYGPCHWPLLKLVVAHELSTGLAIRPEWGPMYGPNAMSEQELAHRAAQRIPVQHGIIADRNFGVFQIAWLLKDRPMLVRLTDSRAKPLVRANLEQDLDVLKRWAPTAWDRKSNPDLPKDASVSGRVVIRHVIGPKGERVSVPIYERPREFSRDARRTLYRTLEH